MLVSMGPFPQALLVSSFPLPFGVSFDSAFDWRLTANFSWSLCVVGLCVASHCFGPFDIGAAVLQIGGHLRRLFRGIRAPLSFSGLSQKTTKVTPVWSPKELWLMKTVAGNLTGLLFVQLTMVDCTMRSTANCQSLFFVAAAFLLLMFPHRPNLLRLFLVTLTLVYCLGLSFLVTVTPISWCVVACWLWSLFSCRSFISFFAVKTSSLCFYGELFDCYICHYFMFFFCS